MMDTDAAALIWKSTSYPVTDSFIAEGLEFFPHFKNSRITHFFSSILILHSVDINSSSSDELVSSGCRKILLNANMVGSTGK